MAYDVIEARYGIEEDRARHIIHANIKSKNLNGRIPLMVLENKELCKNLRAVNDELIRIIEEVNAEYGY